MKSKTDNHNLKAKLDLRRSFLSEFDSEKPFSVVDCFSGESEAIWTQLRNEFNVGEYLALDIKSKPNRIKIDSLRYLRTQTWKHDVIDLDAYGSPWRHWHEVLKRGLSCTVFLTVGSTGFRAQQTEALKVLGITFQVPCGFHSGLEQMVIEANLGLALENFTVDRAAQAENPGGNALYFGLRLQKREKANENA